MWDLIAFLLISLPVPVPDTAPEPLWDALIRVSLHLELADPRESWSRHSPTGFPDEVRCIRGRAEQLQDAPPLSDHYLWLAAADAAPDLMTFNRARREYLAALRDSGLAWHQTGAVCEEIAALDSLHEAWHCAAYVACPHYYSTSRRLALARLRDLIGPVNYLRGTMPSPVLWPRAD